MLKKGDHIEWIPTFYGVEIEEWASWTEDLNVGLTSYYKLDESSGNLIDSVGSLDMVTNAVTYSSTGKINTAILFDSSTDWADSTGPTGSQSGSISFGIRELILIVSEDLLLSMKILMMIMVMVE